MGIFAGTAGDRRAGGAVGVAPAHASGDRWRMLARGTGQLLITIGALILLFVAYELWGTGYYTQAQQHRLDHQLVEQWRHGGVEISQVHIGHVPLGSGVAILWIPRFGRGYHMVVVEGTSYEDLKKGPGHYPETALPGQVGNVAIAGHRTTYLHPFYHLDALRPGDAIVLETRSKWFTYTVRTLPAGHGYPRIPYREIVDPSDVAVAYPVPDQPDPNRRPTRRLLTLTSCNPRYSASQRMVVHAVLTDVVAKSTGRVPAALQEG